MLYELDQTLKPLITQVGKDLPNTQRENRLREKKGREQFKLCKGGGGRSKFYRRENIVPMIFCIYSCNMDQCMCEKIKNENTASLP